jgi:hypothetical protein
MKTEGLLSSEILIAKAELNEAYEVLNAARETVMEKDKIVQQLVDAFWDENLSSANLNEPEDFMLVASAAWQDGAGNARFNKVLDDWIAAKSNRLKFFMWSTGGNEGNDEGFNVMLPVATLVLPCVKAEEDFTALGATVLELNKLFLSINDEYRFNIIENSSGFQGSYQLEVTSEDTAAVICYSHGDHLEFDGPIVECLNYISKNHPSCGCDEHAVYSYLS